MEKLILSVFFGVFIVAALASLMIIQTGKESSGASTWMTTSKTVKCKYWNFDNYGYCVKTEVQEGTTCNPESDVKFHNWEQGQGSLQRPCTSGNSDKF